jgi:hypothetical protein
MAGTDMSRARKGKNFSSDEERQLCCSFLAISQDPIQGNGQKSAAFWDRIATHYREHKPVGGGDRPARSLETKWGIIKHDVAKFVGVHNQVLNTKESGVSLDDLLERALQLYKVKHAKQHSFVFLHCWLILKDVPRWAETREECRLRQQIKVPAAPMPKRKTPPSVAIIIDSDGEVGGQAGSDADLLGGGGKRLSRPCGNKVAKEEQKLEKQRECAIRAQAKATSDMAAASARKAQILHDQAVLALFTMPETSDMSEQARCYLHLRREEEMTKLERRLAAEKVAAAREVAAATREAAENAAEVAQAMKNRVPPPPASPRSPTPAASVDPVVSPLRDDSESQVLDVDLL